MLNFLFQSFYNGNRKTSWTSTDFLLENQSFLFLMSSSSSSSSASRVIHEVDGFDKCDAMYDAMADIAATKKKSCYILIASASWCGPCKKLKTNILNRSQLPDESFHKAEWFVMDVDNNKAIQDELGIKSIPQVFYFDDVGKLLIKTDPLQWLKKQLGSM